jgi:photosystem II stability/assembly factor-like uncharacterized protein
MVTVDVGTEAPGGDIVLALAASPDFARDGVCFAARGSGLYRSDDGAVGWRPLYDSLGLDAPLATTAVALSPGFARDQTLFAGVHGAVLRSRDGGGSWQIVPLPTPPPVVSALVVSPAFDEDGTVLAGTVEDGVFRSADRGDSWTPWNFGLLDLGVLAMAISPRFAEDETLYAGTGSGLYRSTNGGRAWREVEPVAEFAPVLSVALAGDGVVFIGTEACGLLRSDDGGRIWTRLGAGAIAEPVNAVLLAPDPTGGGDLLALLDGALLASRDGGRTWATLAAGEGDGVGLTALAAAPGLGHDGSVLIGFGEGTVRRLRR